MTTRTLGSSFWVGPSTPRALSGSRLQDSLHSSAYIGYQPPLFSWTGEPSNVPAVDYWFRESERVWDSAYHQLQQALRRCRMTAYLRRSNTPVFQPGQKVWLSTWDIRLPLPCKKLSPRFIGPFPIVKQINPVTYQLQLLQGYRIHPSFHVSLLKPFHPSVLSTGPDVTPTEPPLPLILEDGAAYEVHEILDSRCRGGQLEYLVDWEGYGPEERSWVPRNDILDPNLLQTFHDSHPDRPAPQGRGRPPRHRGRGGGGTVTDTSGSNIHPSQCTPFIFVAMSVEKPNFLSQPEVKNIYLYRNGDPYYEPRRLVINAKRVSTFDTLLREVTGGVRAPFGAVRNIYTPKAGHRIDSLEHLRSGEQYVAAGREKFKKIDYLQIGTRKKRTLQPNGVLKPVPQSRVIVSARFLKPIKEPCAIFVVANGDVLNPAVRLLIPSRVIGQFERILEMITEKMGLRIVGGVRSLYTFEGTPVMDGKELENGQFYVAVGRDKFKKLPYGDLLFNKPIGIKRMNGSKAASLPPIYKYRRQNGDVGNHHLSKSEYGQEKSSPPDQSSKEQLSSMVREISQARLMSIRKKRSELTASNEAQDNDDGEDVSAEDNKTSQVEQEAAEASQDIDDSSKTESEPAQNTEESPCDGEEEEKKQEDEKKEMEEEEEKEEDGEIKDEGQTSEQEANETSEEKKDGEADIEDEEDKQVEGAEEENQENTENEGDPEEKTEENPDPSEEGSANTE
ncbi:doublecortin domain-containing protein 2-like [Chanodichthys erythropterus]|uniref:doublecortin domain-containing protein 2-like n=1 Tax=Chanodichthys erythropterus TaxID=933992 RepID=UPI00351E292D